MDRGPGKNLGRCILLGSAILILRLRYPISATTYHFFNVLSVLHDQCIVMMRMCRLIMIPCVIQGKDGSVHALSLVSALRTGNAAMNKRDGNPGRAS